jgi:SH3 domain protein
MRTLSVTITLLLVMTATVMAQSFYVNDVIKVTLRAGPGYDHKILSVLNSGDPVELVERGKDWSRVRLSDGTEGWMATRLLTKEEPNILKIRRLEAQLAAAQADETGPDRSTLEEENKRLEDALAEARLELQATRQTDTDNHGPAPANGEGVLAETRERIRTLETRLSECQGQLGDQTLTAGIRWFLAGAGVLLVGGLIGLKFRRRQRSGLL